jgi:nucleotide-binding universal stress UspA family protein
VVLNKLLIALDDTEPAQYAIDIGLIIAKMDQCPVVFALILDRGILEENAGLSSMCELAERMAADIIARALQRAEAAGVPASAMVMYNDAAQGIIELSATLDAGMIAVGTTAASGIARALTRNVAETVLRRTKTPLCVIRRPPIGHVCHRILVPIADDELAEVVCRYAVDLARGFNSTLLFLTIADRAPSKNGNGVLERAKQFAADSGVQAEGVGLDRCRNICDKILEQAGAHDCDVIVMASHARDGFMRLVKGSVTEAVIRASRMPVIVVR